MNMENQVAKLWESRDAAEKAYADFVEPFNADPSREMTEEELAESQELHTAYVAVEERILEVRKDEKRSRQIAQARADFAPAVPTVKVKKEPRTYGPGSDNSYFFDLGLNERPSHPRHMAARQRLDQYAYEVATHVARDDKEGKRAKHQLTNMIGYRTDSAADKRAAQRNIEERGKGEKPEFRTPMSTALGFGGELVTPVYLESDVVPFRHPGRAFADVCNRMPLPDYGMTVYLPYVSSPAAIAAQSAQNSGIQETDPGTGYLTSNLTTEAGQVTLSQQLLDRAGPNFAFDLLVFDQLQRAYNPAIDSFVLTTALANANAVTYTGTFALYPAAGANPTSTSSFAGHVSQAKANIRTTAGVFLNPTHLFLQPDRAEFMTAIPDTLGRPLITSSPQGPFNAAAGTGDGDYNVEGPAGFRFAGLPVYTDYNIPASSSGLDEQAIVLAANQVWYWESTPVTRAVPQTLANDLSVLLQMYSYVGAIVAYPKAVQVISGTGLLNIVWTA